MIKNTEELKDFILKSLDDKKAANIQLIDLKDSSLARYMIIASGTSKRNVAAMGENLSLEIKKDSNLNIGLEGFETSEWVLVDCGDIVVHLFYPETRERFKLEELWDSKN